MDLHNLNFLLIWLYFLRRRRLFSLSGKHLRNEKQELLAVENNPKNFQYLGKNLRDDDVIFD